MLRERNEDSFYHDAARRKETIEINKSHLALKECIRAIGSEDTTGFVRHCRDDHPFLDATRLVYSATVLQQSRKLENELDVLDGKYKRAVETLQKAKDDAARAPISARGERSIVGESKRDEDEDPLPIVKRQLAPQQPATPLVIVDPSLQEEIDRLKVELASKTMTIHTQADELHELMAELDKLRM
ncbi:hypothetical protein P43SY_000088 [Pythium insidiosum]|uniref:Uncharacterized protein n=1 Tax=Pythium insidiosum TaxID=114742 RepID=A0AAD5M1T0_PYTIN|nr:hypothetical protein P43SY_000088 [Pythium insidiosum]